MPPLFPVLPEDLASLSDAELQSLITDHTSAIELIRSNDADFIGELSGSQVVQALRDGIEQLRALVAVQDGRRQDEQSYTGTVEELAAEGLGLIASSTEEEPEEEAPEEEAPEEEVAPEEEEPEAPAEEGEQPAGEANLEPVTAGASATQFRRPPAPAPDRRGSSQPANGAVLRASAGLSSVTPGQALTPDELREALISAHEITTAKPGEQAKVVVATARFPYPDERRLDGRNAVLNTDRVRPAQALVATGGLCAPFPSFYDLPVISVADRPVRDALVGFQAGRGGVSVPTNLSMTDVAEGVGIVTNEDDEAGGTFAVKNCVTIECEPWTDYDIDAVYACVTHGVLNARAWPERVDAVGDLLAAQHARVAESNLLTQISAGSTAVTDAQWYGAVSSLLQGVLKASAAYRSRHRMRADTRLTAMFPAWIVDMLLADMIHGQFDRFHARDFIRDLLSRAGVNATFYLDTADGNGQIFDAQTAGTLDGWITSVVWYLFDAGHWLFLDFGELNLGIIRDFDLATTNDFAIFRETFEGTAPVGIESLEITSTICPDGTYAPTATAETC